MKKKYLLLLSILSGVLLSLAWPANGFPFLLFVAFVPLLYIEDYIAKNKHNFVKSAVFFYTYIAFVIWNGATTWWIYYSTSFGAAMAIFVNAIFMALVFHLYHLVRRTLFKSKGAFNILLFFWICFEFLHLNWDLSWSWLNLGNGFAAYPQLVQWYEFTGVFGGTFWVLFVNILLYKFLLFTFGIIKSKEKALWLGLAYVFCISLPIGISLARYYNYDESAARYEFVVVQPNIDPYNEKFGEMTQEAQLNKMMGLAQSKVSQETDFLLFPETALPQGLYEHEVNENPCIDSLQKLFILYPKLQIIVGASTLKEYFPGDKITATARSTGNGTFYDVCNTAIFLSKNSAPQFYHKSKLVPGVEKMPFPKLLKPLEKYAIDLGGMTGSNATQEERSAFGNNHQNIKVAPIICYESIYGDFVTGYIRNGANFIGIITNDGWWNNTAGHRQHFEYARLRAVETRRSIARSANTGISGFINQRGDVLQSSVYWTNDVMVAKLAANDKKTFYVLFGDYLGHISLYVSAVILLLQLLSIILNKRKKIIIRKREKQ